MVADMDNARTINICVDDYIINGDNIADRHVVIDRVIVDWGV